jgi:CheY-like chemotaxis protein
MRQKPTAGGERTGRILRVIQGRLREVPLEDILSLIAAGRKSGVLTVTLDEREARVHFEDGRVLYARIEDGANLGEYLVRLELMTPEQVQTLIARQAKENPHTPLGMMAVRQGIITDEDLKRALEVQVLDATTEILIWSDIPRARFHFKDRGADASQVPTQHSMDARALLMEATQRLDEWRRGQVKPHDVLEVAANLQTDERAAQLTLGQWELLYLVDGQRSAASIAAEIHIPEGETYHQLFVLQQSGLLRAATTRPEDPWVLVVTQSQTTRRLVTLTLTRERYRVMLADTLERAFELLHERRPHTVLLEWDGDPIETVKTLRGKTKNLTPVVALVKTEPRVGGLFGRVALPGVRFVVKPYTEMQLIQSVGAITTRAL